MRSLFLIFSLFLASCADIQVEASKPVETAVVAVPGFKAGWADMHLEVMKAEFPRLEKAKKDMARFCPKYSALNEAGRKQAWLYLFSAIMKFESGFNPKSQMGESNGDLSQGLYQLTYGNAFCPKKKSEGDLNDPKVNITCGVKIFSMYTEKDSVVAAGGYVKYGAPEAKGAARYWSVLRVPDLKKKHHLADIIALAKKAPGCI